MTVLKTEIIVPDKVLEPGDLVSFDVRVTSLHEFTLYVEPIARIPDKVFPHFEESIPPGGSFSWPASFTMPEGSVTIKVDTWAESFDFEWRKVSVTNLTVKTGEVGAARFLPGLLATAGILGIVILGRK
ncbi:hypothetical protein LCGC14_0607500 [marine sediment metagenome]|uniref:Uncharacterized protein n=1 Tax=marine sediment metagenome TaxID=412755 RepID=A0A0F9RDI8_9ZZZZ